MLLPEAFDHERYPDGAPIPAATLRKRLPATLRTALKRQKCVYEEDEQHEDTKLVLKSFEDFVALCEKKERETGEPVRIVASY